MMVCKDGDVGFCVENKQVVWLCPNFKNTPIPLKFTDLCLICTQTEVNYLLTVKSLFIRSSTQHFVQHARAEDAFSALIARSSFRTVCQSWLLSPGIGLYLCTDMIVPNITPHCEYKTSGSFAQLRRLTGLSQAIVLARTKLPLKPQNVVFVLCEDKADTTKMLQRHQLSELQTERGKLFHPASSLNAKLG